MEKKKILGKVLPAVLVFILAILFVIVISSCTKTKKTPTGEIVDEKDYIKVDLGEYGTYSISKVDYYNKLRYSGYSIFEDELYATILKSYVDDITADLEANKSNVENSKYYDKFVYIIDNTVYQKTDKKEIERIDEKSRETNEKSYINGIQKIGYETDGTNNIYQYASLLYNVNTLAKREYARSVLSKEVEDEDSDNEITETKIEEYFTNTADNKGDCEMLIIYFSSETEANEALMQLNLKFVGNKVYRVLPTADANNDGIMDADTDEDGTISYAEYEEYYDDFDVTKDGVAPLTNTEYLFELCRVYNYVYGSYRSSLSVKVGSTNYADLATYPANPLTQVFTSEEYKKISELTFDDIKTQIVAQDKGDFPDSPKIKYTYDELYTKDSSLATDLYKTYLACDSEKSAYSTTKATYTKGNYLVFKIQDSYTATYKAIKSLANLKAACATGSTYTEKSINGFIQEIKEEYRTALKALGILDDNAAVKAWALDLADKITLLDVTGADKILESCTVKSTSEKFWNDIFESALSDSYISEVLSDYIEDHCKITIYDTLFEVQYAEKNSDYKKSNKTSKELVAQVKIYDEDGKLTATNDLTVDYMFKMLDQVLGANTTVEILSAQLLKEKYYKEIYDDSKKMKEYNDNYETVLSYFAQGNTTDYGYSPSIGLKAFTQLYFKAETKDEAIFNLWVVDQLGKIAIYESPTDINSDIYANLVKVTEASLNQYVKMDYRTISVYTDDDEDGEIDDWSIVADTDARKIEVQDLAMKLINLMNDRMNNEWTTKSADEAYNLLKSRYGAASRVSQKGDYLNGDPYPTGATSEEIEAYYFAAFKAKGLYVNQENTNVEGYSQYSSYDDSYKKQLQDIYHYILNSGEELKNGQTIAVKLNLNDKYQHSGSTTKVTDVSQLFFSTETGYTSFYVDTTTKSVTFKFEVKDNADDDVNGKVYPYSIIEENPFPIDPETEKPLDNTGAEDSLYNANDLVSINQILIYIKEYNDGVESLSSTVVDAFNAVFETNILKTYISDNGRKVFYYSMIKDAITNGKVTISSDMQTKIANYINCCNASLFSFEVDAVSTAWYAAFNK